MAAPASSSGTPPAFASSATMSLVRPVTTQRAFAAALPRRPAPEELVVVFFAAGRCRACKYAHKQLERVAADADSRRVSFLHLDVDAAGTAPLCRDLGVSAVPAFHFYSFRDAEEGDGEGQEGGVGCLDTLVGPSRVGRVRERVMEFTSGDFDIGDFVFA